MNGILPVWKPEKHTSHDVVAIARRLLRTKRIGHTGTLDPMATGVLPLCVGNATRVVEYIQELDKEYIASFVLGIATDTEDMTGTVTERAASVHVTEAEIKETVAKFIGPIEQIPPMYSAVKIDGKRLYELARRGETAERKPRNVTIIDIELLEMNLTLAYPEIEFRVRCSKGTYIRTLCVDIGKSLGFPAAMTRLVRTAAGNIRSEQCLTLQQIEQLASEGTIQERMIRTDDAISHFARATLPAPFVQGAMNGRRIPADALVGSESHRLFDIDKDNNAFIRLYTDDQRFIGIYTADEGDRSLKPIKLFETRNESH